MVGVTTSTGVFLVKVVVVVVGSAIPLHHLDSAYDSSKPADDANDGESNTDSGFVREKALGGGPGGGRGVNGGCGVDGGEKGTTSHR